MEKTRSRRTNKEIAFDRIGRLEAYAEKARNERVVAAAKEPKASADREQKRYAKASEALAEFRRYVEVDLELKEGKPKRKKKERDERNENDLGETTTGNR